MLGTYVKRNSVYDSMVETKCQIKFNVERAVYALHRASAQEAYTPMYNRKTSNYYKNRLHERIGRVPLKA